MKRTPARLGPLSDEKKRPGRPKGVTQKVARAGREELGRHRFAFLRALLNGVELHAAFDQYLSFTGAGNQGSHRTTRLREVVGHVEHATASRAAGTDPAHKPVPPQASAALLRTLRRLPDYTDPKRPPLAHEAAVSVSTGVHDATDLSDSTVEMSSATAATASPATPLPTAPPSFESWLQARLAEWGVELDFYTHQEWLDLYQEALDELSAATSAGEHPDPSMSALPFPTQSADATKLTAVQHARDAESDAKKVRGRLSMAERQAALETLRLLEVEVSRVPSLADLTSVWLVPSSCQVLGEVGILTLGDLVNFIELYGYRWHRRVRRMGATRARRLVEWLAPLMSAQGRPLKEVALVPQSDLNERRRRTLRGSSVATAGSGPSMDLRSVACGSALPVPPAPPAAPCLGQGLQEALPHFRTDEPNVWGATDDVQAIGQWLSRHRGRTLEQYTRIAERFYLWCTRVLGKPVSAVVEPDVQAYESFLRKPSADWVQEGRVPRADARWRPLRGPLARNSVRQEFAVLGSMFSAMVEAGYLRANVMGGVTRVLGLVVSRMDVRRSLSLAQWAFAFEVLASRPEGPLRRRLELILRLASTTGMRRSELATARVRGLREDRVDGEDVVLLDVLGKGGKVRTVVVFEEVRALIEAHHRDMEEAALGFDGRVSKVAVATPLPRFTDGQRLADGPDSAAADASDPAHWRPLIGILREPPPRRRLDELGLPFVDRKTPTQADRFGALSDGALGNVLKRFFRLVCDKAAQTAGAPDATEFRRASTHWLRHTFANQAIRHMQPQVVQALMGHSDLRVTSVYVKSDATDLVRGMRSMKSASGKV